MSIQICSCVDSMYPNILTCSHLANMPIASRALLGKGLGDPKGNQLDLILFSWLKSTPWVGYFSLIFTISYSILQLLFSRPLSY